MSSVNYSLKHKGVKLIPSEKAWVKGKNGKLKLNPKYNFVGKIDTKMPNLIISASDKGKPKYKGNTHDLCTPAKKQIVEHFYNEDGKRNKRSKAYFGIEKGTSTPKRGKK
jgi:hypothetical protein